MENWGIITFREVDLLAPNGQLGSEGGIAHPHEPSISQLYSVPITVAHEVAHMWFGALNLCSASSHTSRVRSSSACPPT